jgi:hypothetical protein
MNGRLTEEQRRRAEHIVRRWLWAARLSVPADRTVEKGAVGGMAVAFLDQLLAEERRASGGRAA